MMRPAPRIRPRPAPARGSQDDRILPLVNIVFLLLIFFMVAGQLTRTAPFEIVPPRSASEGAAPAGTPVVMVGAQGQLALDGEVMARPALLAALPERLGTKDRLRLKVDGGADAAEVVALVGALEAAGAGDIRLMTIPDGP